MTPDESIASGSAGHRLETPCEWGELLVLDWMASGANADVYLARETALDRLVAFKLYRSEPRVDGTPLMRDPGTVLDEAVLMARVNDPNVVRVYGARRVGDQVGMWMERIRGSTLQEILGTHGSFAADEARVIGRQICGALVAVHKAGLLHRDIKAGNIMREEGGRYLLMDFGVGAVVPENGSVPGLSGTPAYMAPEVLRDGISTIASDIYGLGVLLFHLVTGCFPGDPVPLAGKTGALGARWHREARARLEDHRTDLPAEFVAVIEKAIDPDPGRRFGSAGEMLHALGGQAPAERKKGSRAGRRRVHRKLRWRGTFLKVVIGLVPILLGVWVLAWIARQILNLVVGH